MINENYFENIDTNEKAYWLGFLYADGYIGNINEKLQICLSIKDELHLDKFINCIEDELSKKRYYGPYKTSGKQVHWYTRNKKIINDLINLGCTNKKSHNIRFPKLNSQDLNCAFLLGYFDGDGTTGKRHSDITCGSKQFLEDIKNIFKIENKIQIRSLKYETYALCLGRSLFESLLPYYINSLESKRNNYKDCRNHNQYLEYLKTKEYEYHANLNIRKFEVSKEELEKLINEKPYTEIAKMFGVSDKAITKRAKKLGIILPKRLGYWTKIKQNSQ